MCTKPPGTSWYQGEPEPLCGSRLTKLQIRQSLRPQNNCFETFVFEQNESNKVKKKKKSDYLIIIIRSTWFWREKNLSWIRSQKASEIISRLLIGVYLVKEKIFNGPEKYLAHIPI